MPSAEGGSIRVAARRIEPFVIHVAYTEKVTDAVLEHLLSIFLVLAPIALIVSVAGGWFLSGIVFRPIRQVSSWRGRLLRKIWISKYPPERER